MKSETFYPLGVIINTPDVLWSNDSNYITAFFLDRNVRPATIDFYVGGDKYHAKIGSDYRDTGNEYTTIYLKAMQGDADEWINQLLLHTDITFTARDCHKSWEVPNMVVFDDNLSCYFYVAEYEVFGMYFLLLNMDGNFYLLALDSGDPVQHGGVGTQYDPVILNEGQKIVKWNKIEPKLEVRHDDDSGRNYAVLTADGYDVDMGCDVYDGDSRHATMFFYCGDSQNNRITFDVTFESDYECDGSRLWFDGGIVARHVPNVYELSGDMMLMFRSGRSLPMREHYTQRTYYSYCDGVPEVRTPYTTPAGETIDVDGEQGYQGELRPFEVGRHTFGKSPQPTPTGGCYMHEACMIELHEFPAAETGRQWVFCPAMDALFPPMDGGDTVLIPTDEMCNFSIQRWRGVPVDESRFIVALPYYAQLPMYTEGIIYDKELNDYYPMHVNNAEASGYNWQVTIWFRGNKTAIVGGYEVAPAAVQIQHYGGVVAQGIEWGVFSGPYTYDPIYGPGDPLETGYFNMISDILPAFEGQQWHFEIGEEQFDEVPYFEKSAFSNVNNTCSDVKEIQVTTGDYLRVVATPTPNVYAHADFNSDTLYSLYEWHINGESPRTFDPLPLDVGYEMQVAIYEPFGTTTLPDATTYTPDGIYAIDNDVVIFLDSGNDAGYHPPFPENSDFASLIHTTGVVEDVTFEPYCPQQVSEEPQNIYTGEVPNVDMIPGFTFDVEQRCGDAVLRYVNTDGSICYLVGNVAARHQEVERQSYNRHITSHTDDRVMTARPMAKIISVRRSYVLQFNDVANDAYPEDLLLSEEVELWVGDGFEPCVVDADSIEVEKSGYASNITITVIIQNN